MIKVLFVCMGNICRSPTAEGVFRQHVKKAGLDKRISIDSAGTHSYHVGSPPDERSQEAARIRNVDLSDLSARKVEPSDFKVFDYILAMDRSNLKELKKQCPSEFSDRVQLYLDYSDRYQDKDVPDPYYGGKKGFECVLDLVDDAAKGLLAAIIQKYNL